MKLVIQRVMTKDLSEHERESRLIGKVVEVKNVSVNAPLIAVYVDNPDIALMTSKVEKFNSDWMKSGLLSIETRNSIYEMISLEEGG